MGVRLAEMVLPHAKQIMGCRRLIFKRQSDRHNQKPGTAADSSDNNINNVPKGHFAIYVGGVQEEEKKRFVVPISYLKNPLFQDMLSMAAEEFGFDHQMRAITLLCAEQDFVDLTSRLNTH